MHALDRPLLFGLLALERQFVTAEELVEAFRIWRNQPDGTLDNILASRGKLSTERVRLLEELLADWSLLPKAGVARDLDAGPTTTWRPEATSIANGIDPTRLPDASDVALVAARLDQ